MKNVNRRTLREEWRRELAGKRSRAPCPFWWVGLLSGLSDLSVQGAKEWPFGHPLKQMSADDSSLHVFQIKWDSKFVRCINLEKTGVTVTQTWHKKYGQEKPSQFGGFYWICMSPQLGWQSIKILIYKYQQKKGMVTEKTWHRYVFLIVLSNWNRPYWKSKIGFVCL